VISRRLTPGGWTTIVAVAVRPSLDAVIVAVPAETAVTIPVDVTVATSDRFVDHVVPGLAWPVVAPAPDPARDRTQTSARGYARRYAVLAQPPTGLLCTAPHVAPPRPAAG